MAGRCSGANGRSVTLFTPRHAAGPVVTLLIAVDFSEPSMRALEAGAALARDLQAKVVLVHAFDPIPDVLVGTWTPVVDPSRPFRFEHKVEEVRELSQQWAQKLRDADLEVETVARDGDPVDVVLEEARRTDAHTVVVGSHGWTGLRRLVLGSVSEKIVRHADRPVLVVPRPG